METIVVELRIIITIFFKYYIITYLPPQVRQSFFKVLESEIKVNEILLSGTKSSLAPNLFTD